MSKNDLDNFTVEDSRKWGLLSALAGVLVYFPIGHFIGDDRATLVSLFIALSIFLIRFYRRLIGAWWFWVVFIAIFAVEESLSVSYPEGHWPHGSMIVLAPAALVGVGANVVIISLVAGLIERRPNRRNTDSQPVGSKAGRDSS